MADIEKLLKPFREAAANPKRQLQNYVDAGERAIGCFPYYVPEELVHAAGMVPFSVWGCYNREIRAAKEYFASFYCTIAQLNLELGLTGALDGLSGVIATSLCDTLRPFTQNFRVAVPQIPFLFLAHPQNRAQPYGVDYTVHQYATLRQGLSEICGHAILDESIADAICVYNRSRTTRRRFVQLAGAHPEYISATDRSAVLKSAGFMRKNEHTALLEPLNNALAAAPDSDFHGVRVVTSGIVADSPALLRLFDELGIAIAADDVMHESRGLRVDAPTDCADPVRALALQFAAQDCDTLLYDPTLHARPEHVCSLVRNSGADGVIVLMMQFCDAEEIEYPSLKQALDAAGIRHIMLGFDQQMRDLGQARTALQAFSDMLSL